MFLYSRFIQTILSRYLEPMRQNYFLWSNKKLTLASLAIMILSSYSFGLWVIFYLQPELSSPQGIMVLHLIAESRFLIFFIFAPVRVCLEQVCPGQGLPQSGLPHPGMPDPGLPQSGLSGLPQSGLPHPGMPDSGLHFYNLNSQVCLTQVCHGQVCPIKIAPSRFTP